jgi:type VI secretion system protein ImpJ
MGIDAQHLQQGDRYHQEQLRYVARTLSPFLWGVKNLEFDRQAVANEAVRVNHCEVVFPDGLVYLSAAALEKTFRGRIKETDQTIGVYIRVRAVDSPSDETPRYRRQPVKDCPDFYAPDGMRSSLVEYAVANAELEITNDVRDLDGFEWIKIGIVCRAGRSYEFSKSYIPPMVTVSRASSEMLSNVVTALYGLAERKARELRTARRGGTPARGDLQRLLMLQAVSQFIPAMRNLLENPVEHPYRLFTMLSEFRGTLTTLSPDQEPFKFPAYKHDDLEHSLLPLVSDVQEILLSVQPTNYREYRLIRAGKYFNSDEAQSEVLKSEVLKGQTFVLALLSSDSREGIVSSLKERGRISSIDGIKDVNDMAVEGVFLDFDSSIPESIPRDEPYKYFMIDKDRRTLNGRREWDNVEKSGTFCFHLLDAHKYPKLEATLFFTLSPETT